MKTKLSGKFWCALTLFSLIGQVAWVVENMYLNVFIYKMFNATASDISLMVAASAVSATLTTILIGALSDKVGKRKIFICGGYILWGISIFAFVFVRVDIISYLFPSVVSAAALGSALVIILDCVMTFFGSGANDAAFNAWLTDSTDSTNRGAAEGINAMMPLVAILAVFGGFMAFDLDSPESWSMIFTIIGVVVLAVGIIGLFIIKDSPVSPEKRGYFASVIYSFRPSTVRENKPLYLQLLAFILFNTSIQVFMPYLIIYYEKSLGMTDYVFVMAPAIILASVVTALWGKIYDKKGFAFSSSLSFSWLALGYVILFFCRGYATVFIGSLLMMCGYLSGMAVFGANIRDLIPRGEAGVFQGVRIFSQVLVPGVVGPYIGEAVLRNADTVVNNDGTTSFLPNANIFAAAFAVLVSLVLFILLINGTKKPRLVDLETPFEHDENSSWDEYPRPQLKRDSYLPLNGKWDLALLSKGKNSPLGVITVPYPPESRLSGIGRGLKKGEQYVYTRSFELPEGFNRGKVILHFGAVDQICSVSVNGKALFDSQNGYLPISVDISDVIRGGANEIKVTVTDETDVELPYGKQSKKRGGMWYTPISGIWQSVWLESVPEEHFKDLKISTVGNRVTVKCIGGGEDKLLTLTQENRVTQYRFKGDSLVLSVADPRFWSPEDPYLYNFTLTDGTDRIESYFALRDVSIRQIGDKKYICLNGKPYFFHGLLDQGYFSDGIYTPATPEGYRYDILTMKSLGFNMLRKHIKIEPELFYYYCDKYGMIVFQDMVNSGKYSFLIDTALPTIGKKRGITHKASARRRMEFESGAARTAKLLYNHPSVCYYTVFNEGWGQYDADRIYSELKAIDPSRVWDATSGWFEEKLSDVSSEHVYFKKIPVSADTDRPRVLSEFGGYSCKLVDNSFNLDNTYGYRFFKDSESFSKALAELYVDEILPAAKNGLCAAVLTQVSDVEDETNGLVTYDRQVVKVDSVLMNKISRAVKKAFEEGFK